MSTTLIVALIALAYLLGLASERIAHALARANDRAVEGMLTAALGGHHAVTHYPPDVEADMAQAVALTKALDDVDGLDPWQRSVLDTAMHDAIDREEYR